MGKELKRIAANVALGSSWSRWLSKNFEVSRRMKTKVQVYNKKSRNVCGRGQLAARLVGVKWRQRDRETKLSTKVHERF